MSKRSLLGVLAVLGAVAVVAGFLLVRSSPVQASPTERVRACLRTQGESTRQNPTTVACLRDALVDAARSGGFPEVLALHDELLGTPANASCHAAGHAAGIEMVEEFSMSGSIERMFDGPAASADQVCVAAVVHGLVAGETAGDPPYPLEEVARQCLRLDAVNTVYTYECAHFFGHAVWRSVGELDATLGDLCSLLDPTGDPGLVKACMAGAVMQRFDLQSKHYDPDNLEAKERTPPTKEQLDGLCSAFASSGPVLFDGCMGAVGWLAAISADGELPYDDTGSAAWAEKAFDVYVDRIALCRRNLDCQDNFINHFRVEAYWNGVAERVCRADEVPEDTCTHVLERFTARQTDAG